TRPSAVNIPKTGRLDTPALLTICSAPGPQRAGVVRNTGRNGSGGAPRVEPSAIIMLRDLLPIPSRALEAAGVGGRRPEDVVAEVAVGDEAEPIRSPKPV